MKKKEKKSPSEEASRRNRSIRVSNKDANTIREESNKDRERERGKVKQKQIKSRGESRRRERDFRRRWKRCLKEPVIRELCLRIEASRNCELQVRLKLTRTA